MEGALSCSNRLKKELLFFKGKRPMKIHRVFFKAVQSGLILFSNKDHAMQLPSQVRPDGEYAGERSERTQ